MPTYVYRRPDGTTFEAFQKISEPALATDPETGVPVERVISGGAGLQFKGSGFYLTDYGRGGQPPKKDSSGDSRTGDSTSGDSASGDSASGASGSGASSSKGSDAKGAGGGAGASTDAAPKPAASGASGGNGA